MRKIARLTVRCCVCFTAVFLFLTLTPFVPWTVSWLCGPLARPDGDILIVLTADAQSDGMVGRASYPRAFYAVKAWQTGHFRAVVITGGLPDSRNRSVAFTMAEYMAGSGIPRDRIFLEERSTSTRENALFTKQMIASWPGKRVLLTSDVHMFRARRVFEKVGLSAEPRPVATVHWDRPFDRLPTAITMLVEFLKIAYYRARGWITL
jgi:uncharacterized SAM-binding protein YcdF (DUF218 family)